MRGLSALMFVSLMAAVAASQAQRIVGGSVTNINQYPFKVAIQGIVNNNWRHICSGTILNNRSYLSAAHCFIPPTPAQIRSRVGSTFSTSGGVVHNTASIINHPSHNQMTQDNDISIVRVSPAFGLGGNVATGRIAGSTYNLGDNQQVWAVGWGTISWGGPQSEQLRHVQLVTVNQNTCRGVYSHLTPNMVCAGWAAGGRGPCSTDSGGPLLHNGVVVGVLSFSWQCALPNTPSAYIRTSRYTSWIQQNS